MMDFVRYSSIVLLLLLLTSCGTPALSADSKPTSTMYWEFMHHASATSAPTNVSTATSAVTAMPEPTATPLLPTPTNPPPTVAPDKALYLSFDDGPDPEWTPQILEVLARYNAHATFFVVGRSVASFPDIVQTIRDGGHTLGNHTWNHIPLKGMSSQQFNDEVQTTQAILGDRSTTCLRPPYGATDGNSAAFAQQIGLNIMMWDIDSLDWRTPGSDAISSRVLSLARPNAVVLFHDGGGNREQTVAALDTILSQLSAQGYYFAAPCQ